MSTKFQQDIPVVYMSSDQNPAYLLYMRDYTTQLYGNYVKPL